MTRVTQLCIQCFRDQRVDWAALEPHLHKAVDAAVGNSLRQAFEEGIAQIPLPSEAVEPLVSAIARLAPHLDFEARGSCAGHLRYTWVREYRAGRTVFSAGPWEYEW